MSIIIVPDPKKLGEDMADTLIAIDDKTGPGGCTTKIFIIVVVLSALIYITKFCEGNKLKNTDAKWEKIINSIDSVKKEERIFIINNLEKKRYKINSADGISQINEMLGLPNDGTGFYLAGNGDEFIIGIKLKTWIYDRYYANIKANDIEYTTRENDLTTASFRSDKGGDYLSFEQVVRLKRFYLEQEHTKRIFLIISIALFVLFLFLWHKLFQRGNWWLCLTVVLVAVAIYFIMNSFLFFVNLF